MQPSGPAWRSWRQTLGLRWAVWRSGLFDARWYRARYPDVAAAGQDPLAHYLGPGGQEGRAPSAAFDGARYLAANPDVARADLNPLTHYLLHGRAEGRPCHPLASAAVPEPPAGEARIAFCCVVDTRNPKRDLAYGLAASWHRHCRAWSSLHLVLVGQYPALAAFASRLGAEVAERDPHPLSPHLPFANKWLLAGVDTGTARPVVLDWDMVFTGDPWLLRALPAGSFGARPAPALRLPPALQD